MSSLAKPYLSKFTETKETDDEQNQKKLVTELNDKPEKSEKVHIHLEGDIKVLKSVDLACDGMCCRFSENGEKLAVGLSNGDIKVFRGATGKCIYHLADDDTRKDRLPVTSVNFIPAEISSRGELLLATYASGLVKYWHIGTSTSIQTLHEPFQLLTSAFNPDLSRLLVAGQSERICVYDLETGKKCKTCAPSEDRRVMNGHRFRVFSVKYHPAKSNIFMSGGWDDTVQIWDDRKEHATRRIFGPHICGDAMDIDVRHDHLLTGSWRKDENLQVFNFEDGSNIKTIPPDLKHFSSLYCCQWLGKDHMICGGSDHNVVRIVNKATLATTGMLSHLPSGVYSIDHDRHRLAHNLHRGNDITMITAVAGNRLYFLSNAPVPSKRDE